jgi:hypothetical protein
MYVFWIFYSWSVKGLFGVFLLTWFLNYFQVSCWQGFIRSCVPEITWGKYFNYIMVCRFLVKLWVYSISIIFLDIKIFSPAVCIDVICNMASYAGVIFLNMNFFFSCHLCWYYLQHGFLCRGTLLKIFHRLL